MMPSHHAHLATTAVRTRSLRGVRPALLVAGVLLLSVAACAKSGPSADSSASAATADSSNGKGAMNGMSGMGSMTGMSGSDTGAMAGMAGMGGDSSGMAGMKGMGGMSGMMGDMQKQMDAMMKVSPAQMKAMMPAHRQMVANLLASMTADMRKMNMSGDAAWTATIDSVRQDLTTMPELSGKEMGAAMPAHHARMMRLMGMHMRMSKKMQM
ncbi:MAG: hypothetical protein M3Z10_09150 [Gemmatimonadota bacterium]|nr:hypothetical protein [Gemmatimonadota bacterium]